MRSEISFLILFTSYMDLCYRCGNVAAILELDEHLNKKFRVFEAAPQVHKFFGFLILCAVESSMY